MLLPALLREFLFLQAFLYVSVVAGNNMDGSDSDEYAPDESGSTMGDDNDYQTTPSSDRPTTTQQRKAFFARDPPKPAQSDTAETSTTMSANEGVAIPDGVDQNTTPSPSSPSSTNSPAQSQFFFARDPPGPSQSSESSEMPGSDNESTRTTKEPESDKEDLGKTKDSSEDVTTITTKEPESGEENLRTTKDPSEDVTTTITTKEPESDDENSNSNGRNEFNTQGSDSSSGNRRSRTINHVRPVKSSRNPSDPSYLSSEELHATNEEGFGEPSTNHVIFKQPHYHVQVLSSGVAIPVSPEETTANRRNSQATTTEAPSASSQSKDFGERSSQSINSTFLKFIVDTLTNIIPPKNMRRAFDMRNMSAKTVKTLMYGIVFHFPNGIEVPDAENTCQVLDTALSDNFERVKPLKNSLLLILASAAAKFLMFNKVLSPQNEPDLSDWFVTCFEESLGDISYPTEKQSMYAIGDGFVNFLDSMDLYLPSTPKVLAKYIADGLYAVS